MYTVYTRQLSDEIKKHDVIHHSYADDTQIYIHSEDNPEVHREATDKLQRCIADICEWMEMNALKLNEERRSILYLEETRHLFMMQLRPVITMLQPKTQSRYSVLH